MRTWTSVPPGVSGWVVKPVEIDDVPAVTLTLSSATSDGSTLRRVAEEVTQRLAGVQDVSRAYVVGGQPRVVQILMDPDGMAAHSVSPLELQRAIQGANVRQTAGDFRAKDQTDPRRGRPALRECPAIAGPGRGRVRRPAGLPQGCRPGRGRPGGSCQLTSATAGDRPAGSRNTNSSPEQFWARAKPRHPALARESASDAD